MKKTIERREDIIPRCDNCMFSSDEMSPANQEDGRWIECRKRPPICDMMHLPDDGYSGANSYWPRVERSDWCGEWELSLINEHHQKPMTFRETEILGAKRR